jgi:hypothetical protein
MIYILSLSWLHSKSSETELGIFPIHSFAII